MESENNNKTIRYFELPPPNPNLTTTLNALSIISNGLKEWSVSSKKIEEKTKQDLNKYFKFILSKLEELNDETEICKYLLIEKRKFEARIIEAKINKDGYDRQYYQQYLDLIITPLLKQFELDLELLKKIPYKEKVVEAKISNNTIIDINKQNTETIIAKPIKKAEKVPSETIFPTGFKQIECEATEAEILNYFLILSKEKNNLNDEIYMNAKDVEEFLKNNFSVFNTTPLAKYFPINLLPNQKRTLIYFMFKFYIKFDRKVANTKIKYAMLLINNFDLFKYDNPKILLSNMSESKRPVAKNIISTKALI